MTAVGLFNLKYNFKDYPQIYEKLKSACGYLGYALVFKFSWNVIYRFYRIIYKDLINTDKYKKDSYTFPNQIHFIQQKNINYVVINLSYYNIENSKNEEIIELVKNYIYKGFKIVLIYNRIYKNILKEFLYSIFDSKNQEIKKINFISFNPVWKDELFQNKLEKKLHAFNRSGNKISIFINILNNRTKKYSTENQSFYLFNQILLLKICIHEMLLNKGKSLILSIDLRDNSSPNVSNFDIYQLKNLLKMLRYEYYPKIDIISIPKFNNKFNSIKYYLKKFLKN